jgi:hypothetical protein
MDIIWTRRAAGYYFFYYGGREVAYIQDSSFGLVYHPGWRWMVPQAHKTGRAKTMAAAKVAAEAVIRKYVGDR